MKLRLLISLLLLSVTSTDFAQAMKRSSEELDSCAASTSLKRSAGGAGYTPAPSALALAPDAEENLCGICLMDIASSEYIRKLGCNHEFHKACIKKWFKIRRTGNLPLNCPKCRAEEPDDAEAVLSLEGQLFNAIRNHSIKAVQGCIAAGAKLNARLPNRRTPLHEAILKGQTEISLALINAGASVNAKSSSGSTPLHYAAANGLVHVTLALIVAGSRVNEPNEQGKTPLHLAAERNFLAIVQILLRVAGANPRLRDSTNQTAANLAKTPAIKALIETYIAAGTPTAIQAT